MMHSGQAEGVTQKRQIVLTNAYLAHPERFVHQPPEPPLVPKAVWINPPMAAAKEQEELH